MTEQEFIHELAIARNYASNRDFANAVKCYERIYQTYVDDYHQHYDYRRHKIIYEKYITPPLSIDGEVPATSIRNWKIEHTQYFLQIVNEYTECLILIKNKEFKIENNNIFKRMLNYNQYECKRKNGKWEVVVNNPYEIVLVNSQNLINGIPYWEVEMNTPSVIISMVEKMPTSNSITDWAVDKQFFLSKYRNRDARFYRAIEANYAKISAMKIWQEMFEGEHEQCSIRKDSESIAPCRRGIE